MEILPFVISFLLLLSSADSHRIIIAGEFPGDVSCDVNNPTESCLRSEDDVVYCRPDDLINGRCTDSRTAKVTTQTYVAGAEDITCTNTILEAADCSVDEVQMCFLLNESHWYGGTTIRFLEWPIEKLSMRSIPYITGDAYATPPGYGGVQERYWFNSNGLAVYVDWESPLWVSMNGPNPNFLCLIGRYLDSPYVNDDRALPSLNITACQGRDVRHIHDYMSATYIARPIGIPDEQIFRYPIWSTWAQYKESVDQNKVFEFADAIQSNGFNLSQLEIDDRWEPHYGDLEFDLVKFPDPRAMVDALGARGIRTTLWVHPFINVDSSSLIEAVNSRVYVGDSRSVRVQQQPVFTSWWQGAHSIAIDMTDTNGANWFKNKLVNLQQAHGINSFKFDAGETNWLPYSYRLSQTQSSTRNPSVYTTAYCELAYSIDSQVRQLELRVGAQTQHLPVFIRMMDKDSRWDYNNGLATMIPNALIFGLIGYPFVLPDMVGGNAYTLLPDRELFIRWTELNVFLPSIQFSIVPWQYDAELVQIVNSMMELRARYIQLFIDLARESTLTGAPIVRPLWWIAPNDTFALTIDDEFLVGDDLLVAPVIVQGATTRNIYLPAGRWRDELRNEELDGGRWYDEYRVELHELAYFTRVSPTTSNIKQ